jgi:nucleoside-diphosphate-sugar epimerase
VSAAPRVAIFGFGFLGEALAREFSAAGWAVTCASLSGTAGCIACDLGDPAAVRDVAQQAGLTDFVVHCAASGRGGADAYQRVYVEGIKNLLGAFPGVPLLFTSSTSVYGQTDGSLVDESSPAIPDRQTSQLLLDAERLVLDANGIVARLSGIYGPGRSMILQKFLAGEAVIEEDGRRFLNQVHRDDIATAILHLANHRNDFPGTVFNITDSTPLSQLDCYSALSRQFSLPLPPSGPRDLNRKRAWTHKRVANAKLLATGWQPRFPSFLDAAAAVAPSLAVHPRHD